MTAHKEVKDSDWSFQGRSEDQVAESNAEMMVVFGIAAVFVLGYLLYSGLSWLWENGHTLPFIG